MATDERWYFTKDQINSSPSRKCGIDAEKELQYRQQGSKLIQDMGQRLQVTQLVINTAIVYMHRFYMFHSFSRFHRNSIGPAALFLAAKVEEMPRKLEHVIKVAHYIICHHEHTNLDIQSEAYQEKAQELVMNENILLQTLGFDVAIDHPHVYVLKCFQMIRTTTELAQTSYFMATNSLHMTTMCLQYRPAVVACVCIYIVCKWSNYEIQRFTEEGKDWFCHVDPTITLELLQTLTTDFLAVLEKYPSRLKKLMTSGGPSSSSAVGEERQSRHGSSLGLGIRSNSLGSVPTPAPGQRNADAKSQPKSSSQPTPTKTVLSHREYSEKKEKERKEREKLLTLPPPSSLANTAVSVSSSQLRSPLVPPEGLRKPQPDQLRHPNAAQSQLAPRMAPLAHSVKEPSVKREVSVPVRASDRDSRTSDISDNVLKINSDKHKHIYDHRHNVDWNNLKNLDDSKDRKSDFKTLPKDHRTIDQRESRQSLNSNVNSIVDFKANAVKPEPLPVKVKEDKIDLKPDSKGQFLEDIKPASSFIFNNNDFSLRDFLNPSEMPPEDIFDTESDPKIFSDDQKIKEEEAIPEEELFSCETTHRKLLSPPIVPPSAGYSTNAAQKTNNSNTPSSKANIEVNSSSNSKSNSKHASPKTPSVSSSHTSTKSVPVVPPSSIHPSIPTPVPVNSEHTSQSKKKENNHSLNPATPVNQKSKVLNADPAVWLSSIARNDELKHSGTKVAEASPQVLPRDAISSTAPNSSNVFPSLTTQQAKLSSQKYNTPKSSQVDHPKVESTLQDRLFRQDPPESNSNAPLQLFPLSNEASAGHTKSKKHKHEHGRHKHKEKKKHKHKDKDKHRDKESKEHKKNKKHKKHKEKDKEKVKHGLVKEDSSMPLKITLKKGVYTPEPSSTTLVLDSVLSSQSKEKHSSVDVDTPGRIKLTIPKSRLQSGASGSQESSNDMPMTPKVKLKLHKESRKRDREHSSSSLPSKMARTSSNFLS